MTNKQVKLLTFVMVVLISLASVFFLHNISGQSVGVYSRSGMYVNFDKKTGCYYLEGTAGAKTALLDKFNRDCAKNISTEIFVQRIVGPKPER